MFAMFSNFYSAILFLSGDKDLIALLAGLKDDSPFDLLSSLSL